MGRGRRRPQVQIGPAPSKDITKDSSDYIHIDISLNARAARKVYDQSKSKQYDVVICKPVPTLKTWVTGMLRGS